MLFFLLHYDLTNKIFRLERDLGLGITNTDDPTSESHFIDRHLVGLSTAHSLDDDIRSEACRHL